MSKTKIKVADLPEFDMAEHLDSDQAIAEYLTVVLDENDPAALADALGTIARARGMTDVARASGLTREALYKALRPNAQPRFETIVRVCAAFGVRLVAQAADQAIFTTRSKAVATAVNAEHGRIIIAPSNRPSYELHDLVARITCENRHAPLDWGSAVGREVTP